MGVCEQGCRVCTRVHNRVLAEMGAIRWAAALVRDQVWCSGVSLVTGRKIARRFACFRVCRAKIGVGPLSIGADTLGNEWVCGDIDLVIRRFSFSPLLANTLETGTGR